MEKQDTPIALERPFSLNNLMLLGLFVSFFLYPFGRLQSLLIPDMTLSVIILPILCLTVLFRYRLKLKIPTVVFPLCGFAVWACLWLFKAPGDNYLEIAFMVFYASMVIMIFNLSMQVRDIDRLLYLYVAGLSIVSIATVLSYLSLLPGDFFGELPLIQNFDYNAYATIVHGSKENPNAFAVFFIIAIPIAFYLRKKADRPRLKKLLGYTLILLCFTLFITLSRSAILAAGISTLGYFFLLGKINVRRGIFYLGLLGIVFAIAINAVSILTVVGGTVKHADEIATEKITETAIEMKNEGGFIGFVGKQILTILDILKRGGTKHFDIRSTTMAKDISTELHIHVTFLALRIMMEHPLFGIGYGNFSEHLLALDPALEIYEIDTPHNSIIGMGVYFGIPALILFSAFTLWVFWGVFCATRDDRMETEKRNLAALFLGLLIGYYLNMLFHDSHNSSLFWLCLGLAVRFMRPCTAIELRDTLYLRFRKTVNQV